MKRMLENQADLIRDRRPAGFIMRHSIREEIADLRDPFKAMLTEEGREAAVFFGSLLPTERPVSFVTSTVQRCRDTAEFIGHGVTGAGGRVLGFQSDDRLKELGGRDEKALLHEVQARGPHLFFNDWLGGRIPSEAGLFLFDEAAAAFKAELSSMLVEGALTIFVTHDFHLNYLRPDRESLLEENFRWPGFLEGFAVE